MTPSLFAGSTAPDEYTFCLQADAQQRRRLRRHRDTYITEADFAWLKQVGVEAVRIPVGYWLFGDSEPYVATVGYLDKAFAWAQKHGLQIMISLHGAPGSQNGTMHSGRQGAIAWPVGQTNREQTLDVVRRLAERYGRSPQLQAIGLLNEPSPKLPKRLLKQYYYEAYRIVRGQCGDGVQVVMSDGFRPWRWQLVLHRLRYRNVAIDTHRYRTFSAWHKWLPYHWHLRLTRLVTPGLLWLLSWHHPVVVGEWSAVLDSRTLRGLDKSTGQAVGRAYCLAQLRAYDRADAWYFWSYKTESPDNWNFRACHDKGWFDGFLEPR